MRAHCFCPGFTLPVKSWDCTVLFLGLDIQPPGCQGACVKSWVLGRNQTLNSIRSQILCFMGEPGPSTSTAGFLGVRSEAP